MCAMFYLKDYHHYYCSFYIDSEENTDYMFYVYTNKNNTKEPTKFSYSFL